MFLQNPTGLSIHQNNHFLLQELQTCFNYGAGVTRVVDKGEDPFDLGCWSYITLRGKQSVKITIITAYNATPSPGDRTYYHQQLCVLSRLYREQNNLANPNPRCQFMLDLQSWMEYLSQEGHQFILAMDANSVYDLDQIAQKQTPRVLKWLFEGQLCT